MTEWVEDRPTGGARALDTGELWRARELVAFLAARDSKVRDGPPGEDVVDVGALTQDETRVWAAGAGRLRVEGGGEARPDRLVRPRAAWGVTTEVPA